MTGPSCECKRPTNFELRNETKQLFRKHIRPKKRIQLTKFVFFFFHFLQTAYLLAMLLLFFEPMVHVNGYGFDSGASCSPKTSRRGRARLLSAIPCDLTVQAYCNLPGSLYPWNAVRRFVHENHGLMKRMYGDVRHISILRNEMNSNEIELDDVEETAARYSRSGWKKNKYLYADYQKLKNSELLTEPHFRRAPTSTTSGSTTSTTTTEKLKEASLTVDLVGEDTDPSLGLTNPPFKGAYQNTTELPAQQRETTDNIKIITAPDLTLTNSEASTISTTLRIFGLRETILTTTSKPNALKVESTTGRPRTPSKLISPPPVANLEASSVDFIEATERLNDEEPVTSPPDEVKSSIEANASQLLSEEIIPKQANKQSLPAEGSPGPLFQDGQKDESIFVNSRGV